MKLAHCMVVTAEDRLSTSNDATHGELANMKTSGAAAPTPEFTILAR
jgi:hypothetical protein